MPRKKSIEYVEQQYDIGNGATVTVRFDPERRPKMRHDDAVAIIGPHECRRDRIIDVSDEVRAEIERSGGQIGVFNTPKRGGNFGFDEGDPQYQERKAALSLFPPPAPPGVSPKVLTTEDVLRESGIDMGGQTLDLGAAVLGSMPIPEE